MDTYKIDAASRGLFRVTVTASNGDTVVRDGFVSEWAAQKWIEKRQKKNERNQDSRSISE